MGCVEVERALPGKHQLTIKTFGQAASHVHHKPGWHGMYVLLHCTVSLPTQQFSAVTLITTVQRYQKGT
jgi:heme-degrading monooxygenase HmoA